MTWNTGAGSASISRRRAGSGVRCRMIRSFHGGRWCTRSIMGVGISGSRMGQCDARAFYVELRGILAGRKNLRRIK